MAGRTLFDALSRRVPTILVVTWCAALLAYWVNAPLWLPYGLAIIVGGLALIVMATRDRRTRLGSDAQPGSPGEESWIAQELAGKGSPGGFYVLEFFGLVTVMLTGVEGAYAMPAWAGLALGAAWGISNARYSAGE